MQFDLIFWQFWLFIIVKLVVILLLVVDRSKAFLPAPPSWPAKSFSIFNVIDLLLSLLFLFFCLLWAYLVLF